MAGKEEKKFIIIERDKDQNGPFIVEDFKGIAPKLFTFKVDGAVLAVPILTIIPIPSI